MDWLRLEWSSTSWQYRLCDVKPHCMHGCRLRLVIHNHVALNPDTSEAAMYGTASRVQSLKGDTFITVAGAPVELSHSIKSLGVTIDEYLTFDEHVRNVCKSSYYHIYGTLEQPCQRIPLAQWLQQSLVQDWIIAMPFWLEYPRPTSTNCSVSTILWPKLSRELVVVITSRQSLQIYTGYQSVHG